MRHIRYLGDIPLAHVAVKLMGVVNTASREKARVRIGKNVAEGDYETAEVGGML